MPHGRHREGSRWLWEATGGVAGRVQNIDFSLVFIVFQRFPYMLCSLRLLCALGGAHAEPKIGIVDSAGVL